MTHKHWEFDSICPKCGHSTRVSAPLGELVVRVHCDHCSHWI
ncbi:zinc ribbon domain-containing protein [Alicyclobacillus acidoterrestris]